MLLLFFTVSVLLSVSALIFRSKAVARLITLTFAAVVILFTVYSWFNLNETELSYFTYDSSGVLLLTVLAAVSPIWTAIRSISRAMHLSICNDSGTSRPASDSMSRA